MKNYGTSPNTVIVVLIPWQWKITNFVIPKACLQYFLTKSSGFMHFLPITSCHRRFFNITVFGAKSEYLEQIPSRLNLFVLTFGIHVHYQFSSIDFRKDSITMRHKDLVSRCHHLFEVFLIFHIRTKYTSILYTVSSYFSLLKVLGHYGC